MLEAAPTLRAIVTPQGARIVSFAPSWLRVVNPGAGRMISRDGMRARAFPAALDGPMFGNGVVQYRLVDQVAGVDVPSQFPLRGFTLSVDGNGVATIADGATVARGAKVAVQLYPPLVRNGLAGNFTDQSNNARAAVVRWPDGGLGFAIGAGTLRAFAQALAAAGVNDAGYTDGSSSTTLLVGQSAFGASPARPVPSWLVATPPRERSNLAVPIVAAATIAGAVWLVSKLAARSPHD